MRQSDLSRLVPIPRRAGNSDYMPSSSMALCDPAALSSAPTSIETVSDSCTDTHHRATSPAAEGVPRLRPRTLTDQEIDAIGDPLSGFPELVQRPLARIALRHVTAYAVVDEALDQRLGQLELVGGDGDEAVSKRVVPDPSTPPRILPSRRRT